MKTLASNKKAYFNFDILDKFEAGINLYGWEVKSIKAARLSLTGAYIKERLGELFVEGMHVSPLKTASVVEGGAIRERKLLLHKREISKIANLVHVSGNTAIPLEVVQNDKGLIKVEVAVVRGRKKFDKRAKIKEREEKRRIDADRKRYNI